MPRDAAPGASWDGASRRAREARAPGATQCPAAMLYGAGHVVVYGNPPFQALFGSACIGLPAAEALLDLPGSAFDVMDVAFREGRPVACRIPLFGTVWRMTVADRRDIGTGEVYGIAIRLVPQVPAESIG